MKLLSILFALLLALNSSTAFADSWAPPTVETYQSANGQFRLTVIPRELESALDFFEDSVAGRDRPGQARGGSGQATGILERKLDSGGWSQIWLEPLVNDVAPVRAIVSDGGRYVVTFDNWHFIGMGDQTVVIYDRQGAPIRSLALTDFLPDDYVMALPRSTSSIHWGGEHRFSEDGERLILQILVPREGRPFGDPEFVEMEIGLDSGEPIEASGEAWAAARHAAAPIMQARFAERREYLAWMSAPLRAPTGDDQWEWRRFLREAFHRLDPDWESEEPRVVYVGKPDDGDYRQELDWLSEDFLAPEPHDTEAEDSLEDPALLEDLFGTIPVIGSADPQNLATLLADLAAEIPAGKLRGTRLYLVSPEPAGARVAQAFDLSGARVIVIDPAEPIPQRPERVPDVDLMGN